MESEKVWVFDPVDGTKGFLRGENYAIALALLQNGVPQLSVMACPKLPFLAGAPKGGTVFYAVRGEGAFQRPLADREATWTRAQVSQDSENCKLVESFESLHSDHSLSKACLEELNMPYTIQRMDSQAKYAAVARGDANLYLRFSKMGYRECVWDHAPGTLLVLEAGGVVTDANGGQLDFGKGSRLSPANGDGIVVGNPTMHSRVLSTVLELSQKKLAQSH